MIIGEAYKRSGACFIYGFHLCDFRFSVWAGRVGVYLLAERRACRAVLPLDRDHLAETEFSAVGSSHCNLIHVPADVFYGISFRRTVYIYSARIIVFGRIISRSARSVSLTLPPFF